MTKLHLSLFSKIALNLIFLFTLAILSSGYILMINQNNNMLAEKDKLAYTSAKTLGEGSIDALISHDFEFLESWLKAVVLTDIYAYGYLSDNKGQILVHTDMDKIARYTKLPSSKISTIHNLEYNNRPVKEIIYVSRIGDEIVSNAHIAYYTDTSFFSIFTHDGIYILFFVLFLFLSIILLATLYIIRRHTKPVTELSTSIQKFSFDNNSSIAPSILERPDEIGVLAHSFKQLLNRLKSAYQDLKNEELSLQQKVENRTKDLKDQNELLIKMQNQLVESEKMASLGNLVAGVAHEINTPIGICLTAITHLNDASKDVQEKYEQDKLSESEFINFLTLSHDSCEIANENIKRAAQLISNFKNVAVSQHTDKKTCFNLYSQLEHLIKILIPKNRGTSITITITGEPSLLINSYQSAFYQIFSNLITNSLIHGFESMEQGQIKIDFEVQDGQLTLTYSDNGQGVSEKIVERIFDPFVTTKRGQGGSGLGTHIIYNLVVQKLGGSISCHSELDKGAQFIISFPIEDC